MKWSSVNLPVVHLWGEIAWNSADELLNAIGDERNLLFSVDVNGGDAESAFKIHDTLRGRVDVTTITGRAVSGGYIIAATGDRIRMERKGRILIHAPTVSVMGGRSALVASHKILGELAERCADTVSSRRRIKRKLVASWYLDEQEHVFTADEALAIGLIDEIYDAPQIPPTFAAVSAEGKVDDGKAALLMDLLRALGPIQCADRAALMRNINAWAAHYVR